MPNSSRNGLLAAGNFITDYVKIIDAWPDQDMLATISSESMSNGGGPYNVLKDLAALGVDYPLEAAGLLGDDANGRWIREDCAAHGINPAQLRTTTEASTSYTDAMCVESDGRRTFFHQRGANALFAPEHVDLDASDAKILLLGYLLLLDTMDRLDDDGRTDASRLLEAARAKGFLTAMETVSTVDATFRNVVVASLKHADIFFLNEVEASLILGDELETTSASLRHAADGIAALGSPGRVVVHCARGAVCREADGTLFEQAALELPSDFIAGSTGAGDGFTTGFLHGVHQGADAQTSLLQGVCVAAQSLTHPAASGGIRPLAECMALAERFAFQTF
ncbi:MAG: carbohydrate kinase family protein [Pirellulales bacterium]|nr:carbohydrate kinase family protein [Pirellulales bacterium]